MKRTFAAMTAALMMVALVSSVAIAGPSFTQATGSVGLSNPTQFMSFNAFDYGATGDRGTVSYANWEFASPGSGVWHVGNLTAIKFWLGGVAYVHSVSLTVTPISVTSSTFSGTGTDVLANPTTITGTQVGSVITFVITGTDFVITGSGTIAADGSMAGNASALEGGVTTLFAWTAPAASASEILSYTASIYTVSVSSPTASFTFTIPAGNPISGTVVTISMTDGGSPGAGHDTLFIQGHPYTIVSGNLVVH